MPSPYSNDLREKVLAAIHKGTQKSKVIEMFGVSRDSIDRWLKRRAAAGHAHAKSGYQKGHSHCITDWTAFHAFAQKHGDKTQAEMVQLWPSKVSSRSISRALNTL
ncbi:MAG: IS630 transposase-related protein [Leptolyngbyaceae cyanobacterium]